MKSAVRSRGVVLKKYFPTRCKIALLDQRFGRIYAVPPSWASASCVANGAVLDYDIVERNQVFFVDAIELCSHPVCRDEQTLLFVHHVLEVCAFCLPVGAGAHESFDLLSDLICGVGQRPDDEVWQRVMLAKLLFSSGLYPQGIERLGISRILHQSGGAVVDYAKDKRARRELEIFIYQCIRQHPAGQWLKTVNFL